MVPGLHERETAKTFQARLLRWRRGKGLGFNLSQRGGQLFFESCWSGRPVRMSDSLRLVREVDEHLGADVEVVFRRYPRVRTVEVPVLLVGPEAIASQHDRGASVGP